MILINAMRACSVIFADSPSASPTADSAAMRADGDAGSAPLTCHIRKAPFSCHIRKAPSTCHIRKAPLSCHIRKVAHRLERRAQPLVIGAQLSYELVCRVLADFGDSLDLLGAVSVPGINN